MSSRLNCIAAALTLLLFTVPARAEENSGLRICSQNLFRYGESKSGDSPEKRSKQLDYLITRFKRADCDVIAVQEVVGSNEREAQRRLAEIASALSFRSGDRFSALVGDSRDEFIRNGFIYRERRVTIEEKKNFLDYSLPRLQSRGPGGSFIRAPFALLLSDKLSNLKVWLLNVHFKSRSFGFKDPSGTNFEILRMEMAEATRAITAAESKRLGQAVVPLLVGDRNSDLGSATSEILSGRLELPDFKSGGPCQLDEEEQVECRDSKRKEASLLPLFELRRSLYPSEYRGGSYLYRGKQELLDEFYLPSPYLHLAQGKNQRLRIGFEGDFYKGSDHKLIWLELSPQ